MVSFIVYDIVFMIVFTLVISLLLYKNKKNVKREGVMFTYHTQWGTKSMKTIDDKFHKVIGVARYAVVILGFVLMIAMIAMLIQSAWNYITIPELSEIIKAPPIAPLIPYFPQLFGMESMFPPFYFVYFLIAISIVGLVHEFSHGIFMRYSKTKIKSTGIVFLGPIPGAFVEQDDKSFKKKSRFNQMSVLGAGVFANTLTAIIFYLLYIGFFAISFSPAGYVFNTYSISQLNTADITNISQMGEYGIISTAEADYFLDIEMLDKFSTQDNFFAYDNTSAFRAGLVGIIVGVDDVKISEQSDLAVALAKYKPNDKVVIHTLIDENETSYDIILGEHPVDSEKAYLGVGNTQSLDKSSTLKRFLTTLMGFKDSSINYETTWNEDFVYFIYHLLWWVMIINILVALFNMLPWGILDGGRFFELAMDKFFGEKTTKILTRIMGRAILAILVVMMGYWFVRLF